MVHTLHDGVVYEEENEVDQKDEQEERAKVRRLNEHSAQCTEKKITMPMTRTYFSENKF